jgi:hypothetical protein
MNEVPYSASPVIIRKCGSSFNFTSSPEKLLNRVFPVLMIICARNDNITFSADNILIPQQMVATAITYTWKEETQEVIPQIIKPFHAAGRKGI